MNTVINFLNNKILPLANKMSTQRHMAAIRRGLVATMPLTIVGSMFTILLNIPIESIANMIAPFKNALDVPFRFTVGIMSVYATFGIASSLAKTYKLDETTSGMLAILAFFISSVPEIILMESVSGIMDAGRYLNIAKLSSAGLFGAIVAALVTVEIYQFMNAKNIVIKMPNGVPPEVANSFTALLPTVVVILLFWFVRYALNFDISIFLSNLLLPLKNILAGNSLFGGLLTVFLITFFWVLGIHGPAILGPVMRPFWDLSIAENMEVFNMHGNAFDLPNIFTEQFLQWYVWIGGAGGTLALVCLMMFSKSQYIKKLGRLSFLPGVFNINEPVIFGAPIVMNPLLGIPFILGPIVGALLSYFLTIIDFVPKMMARITFTFPAPIAAWMSSNWNWNAVALVMINFLIYLAIYYPFFKVFEKQELEKEEVNAKQLRKKE